MTDATVVQTTAHDSAEAGRDLGSRIAEAFSDSPADAVILFASSRFDYAALLTALDSTCHPRLMVGCSSAGEFTSGMQAEGSACAIALRSPEMAFRAALGRGLTTNREGAAIEMVSSFGGMHTHDYRFRTALVLADALAGYTDEVLDHLTRLTGGAYRFFGGGAGDDAQFQETHVFYGTEAFTDAVVALEILSNKPIGIGVRHGWEPASDAMRVTEAEGSRLVSMNAIPSVEVFEEYADISGQHFDAEHPLPFFLHNTIGIDTGTGYKLRVPLASNEDGSFTCASDIPTGATTRIMKTTAPSAITAAADAAADATRQIEGFEPKVALFFDCVATRLRIGNEFGFELAAVQDTLGPVQYAGCNTYGQIARAEGQFSGFHNCTAVVCVIPD
jgi:hypothetical protein